MRESSTIFRRELTADERSRMGSANIAAAFDFLESLADNPDLIDQIPDGATVIMSETGNSWVDDQNAWMKANKQDAIESREILAHLY